MRQAPPTEFVTQRCWVAEHRDGAGGGAVRGGTDRSPDEQTLSGQGDCFNWLTVQEQIFSGANS